MNKAFEKILFKIEEHFDSTENRDMRLSYHHAMEIVKEVAEEYNNVWIPCSERLPSPKTKSFGNNSKRENVLVTLKNGVVKEMTYEFATKEFWEAGDENYIEHWKEDYNGNDIEVIAWMPLPEPYQPKGE